MKKLALGLLVSTLLPILSTSAVAHDLSASTGCFRCCDAPAHWAARHDAHDARLAITSESGEAVLLITDDVVAVQLSDRTLRRVRHKLRDVEDQDDDNAIAQVIKIAVLSTVRTLLDHSAECSIRDLDDVAYRDGRLVFTTTDGDCIFSNFDISDDDVMQGFSERDVRAFVKEFHRVKNHIR